MDIFFLHHKTLTINHIKMSLDSIKNLIDIVNNLYIYNSDEDFDSNEIKKYAISIGCEENKICVINNTTTSLTKDIVFLTKYIRESEKIDEYILFIKSDYCLSSNFKDIFVKDIIGKDFECWTLSGMNAKEFVTDNEIVDRLKSTFRFVDAETFYRGGDLSEPRNEVAPMFNGQIALDTDSRIKYVSHRIRNDYNVHVFKKRAFNKTFFLDPDKTWGGFIEFFKNFKMIENDSCFFIHKFHDIISKNRATSRDDVRKIQFGNRY